MKRSPSNQKPSFDRTRSQDSAERKLGIVLHAIQLIKECETLSELLQAYLEYSLRVIDAEKGTIQLLDSLTEELVVRATTGDIQQRKYQRIALDQGITGRVAREKRMVYVPDVSIDPDYLGFFRETRSELTIPLLVNGDILGVLNAEHSQVDAFDIHDRHLFAFLASTMAILIRERVRLEEAVQRQVKAELDAGVAVVTQSIAHSIKNYLGSARIQLDNVVRQTELSPEQCEELKRVDANIKRCVVITDYFFKPYHPAPKVEVSIELLVKDALDLFGELSDITILVSVPDGLPKVYIEANSAVDYFHELLTNAVRVVREQLRDGQIDEGRVEILGRLDDEGHVELLFTNNGPPIAKDQWENIFYQFSGPSREQRASGGLGLGLWGARTFFRRQGGDVFVLESDEAYTTFVVKLPTVTAASELL
jgi:signal transduction histidine kinase